MKIRRVLTLGLAAGALVLAGCTTGEGEGGGGGGEGGGGGGGGVEAGDIRIDVVTHAAPGDSFWDVVKAGSDRAGEDLGVNLGVLRAILRGDRNVRLPALDHDVRPVDVDRR